MPITTSVDTLWDLCNELLNAAVFSLTDNGLEVPEHLLVSWHAPAWDCCDHLGVHVPVIRPSRAATAGVQRMAAHEAGTVFDTDLMLTLVGCAATGDPIPSDADINDNAHTMYQRAWVLYQDLACRFVAGSLLADFDGCKLIKIGNLQPHPPMGGCEALTITFTVEML